MLHKLRIAMVRPGRERLSDIAVEDKDNHLGRIRLRKVQGASAGSSVRTDDWNGYIGLSSKGHNHIVMRQSANVGENLLPLSHRVAALLKKWLHGTHQGAVRGSHLDFYLDEFTFRFNRRTSRSRGKLFFRLIQVVTDYIRKPQDMVST